MSEANPLPMKPLAELVTARNVKVAGVKHPDRPYIGLEHMATRDSNLIGSLPSWESVSTNNVFEQNDILFGKLRPNLRKCVLATFPGYCSTDILVLRVTEESVPAFTVKVLQSDMVSRLATATAVGTKMPRTNWPALRALSVFAPSIEEQRRIATILDTLDESIRQTERVIEKLRRMKQGLLHDLLTRGLDAHGQLRDPQRHPEQFKDSLLGRVPREWEVTVLGHVLQTTTYGISTSLSTEGDVPVLRMNNFSEGEADLADLKYCSRTDAEGLHLRPGDVLFNRTNSIEHVGRTGIWRGQLPSATFASYLVRLTPVLGRLIGEYLNRWLNLRATQLLIRRWATPGVQQVNINPTNLQKTAIAMPRDLEEQGRICEFLAQHDRSLLEERRSLAKLRTLKHGLMDDLLTGRVRVDALEEAHA